MSQISSGSQGGWGWPFQCTNCGRPYPEAGFPYRCPACQGIFDFSEPLRFEPPVSVGSVRRGLGRFRHSFPLPVSARLVTLGEGNTPLVPVELEDRRVFFKCEHLNPTGSFKDRGSVVLVSALHAAGVRRAVEDSSGNAGASFAAYAARAGLHAQVFVPAYASGPKRAQIEALGADVVAVEGPRSQAARAVQDAAEGGAVYASHAYLPHGLAGFATLAFELVEQLGEAPGAFILPVGHGTLLLGAQRGFSALKAAGAIKKMPLILGVQAAACAPLWILQQWGSAGLSRLEEAETAAEGIRIAHPNRGDAVFRAVQESGGSFYAVSEQEIVSGRDALGLRGFYVEPTSAVVWPVLLDALQSLPDPVVVVLTGTGFKSNTALILEKVRS